MMMVHNTDFNKGVALLENTKLRCDDFVTSENFISNISSLEDKLLDANYEMIYGQGTITNLVDLAKGDFDFAIFENIEMSDVAAGYYSVKKLVLSLAVLATERLV